MLVTSMFIAPIVLIGLEKANLSPTRTPAKKALELWLVFLQLYFAIPVGLAYFPRMGTIQANELEP